MFYDTEIDVLSDLHAESFQRIMGDFQPYRKILNFEDGYELEITNRIFCDKVTFIHMGSYLFIGDDFFKVMDIKTWSDYMEVGLYRCSNSIGG